MKNGFLTKLKTGGQRINLKPSDIFAAFCAAFVVASAVFSISVGDFTNLLYIRGASIIPSVVITVLGTVLIIGVAIALRSEKFIPWALLTSALFLSAVLVIEHPEDIFLDIGIAFVFVFVIKYFTDKNAAEKLFSTLTKRTSLAVTVALFAVYVVAVFILTAAKYKSFYHATYDFGIFAQMFEQMAKTGLPYTTVERSTYLSHFAVHFSPIFYVFLPFYYIFRTPLYLLFVQAAVTGAGVFPLRGIMRHLGLSERANLAFSAVCLFFPTMALGCFCDFHENKILSVLILTTLYFLLKDKYVPATVSALLVLFVKEDAVVYVLAIALFVIVSKKGKAKLYGVGLAVFSIAYFVFACSMIRISGGEIMSNRFENYSMSGGLIGAVKTCFADIGYLIKEVFSGADTEAFREMTYSGQKLEFVLWTTLPLAFLPFMQKKLSNLVLLLPVLVINLMPSWMYQYDIRFQYTYGSAALIIFLAALAYSGIKSKKIRAFALVFCIVMTAVMTISSTGPRAGNFIERYLNNKEKYDATEKILETIPEDASVTAYGYMMPHLSHIDDLHTCPDYYGVYEATDYYVVDKRYQFDDHTEKMYDAMGDNYEEFESGGYVIIYKLKEGATGG